MVAVQKLLKYIIPITIMFILAGFYFLGKGGAFPKLERITENPEELLPDVTIGMDKLSADTPTIPSEHNEQLASMRRAIGKMLKEEAGKDCFVDYGFFSALGDGGTTIQMAYDGQNTRFTVKGGKGGKQIVDSFTIEKMIPCVIAGSKQITENFQGRIIGGNPLSGDYFAGVTAIGIVQSDGGLFGFTENRINYGKGLKDFEGQRWLFTPDNKHICFFPTVDTWSDADGLNDDLIGQFTGLRKCQ